MSHIGIFAYGSLMDELGEVASAIDTRINGTNGFKIYLNV